MKAGFDTRFRRARATRRPGGEGHDPVAEDDPLDVEGFVVRYSNGEIAVHCKTRPIPLAIVLREQRRLRRQFRFRE